MSFTFSARALLGLGKDLISSDDVALSELIKNAVDAQYDSKSPRLEIIVNVQLRYSDYREATDGIKEERRSLPDTIDFILEKLADRDSADAIKLQEKLSGIQRKEAFLERLGKLYDQLNYIEVRDAGHGMSLKELSDVFLRIGTRSRRQHNAKGSRYLGNKGIGRLSAMRLGDHLQVKTCRAEDLRWNLLDIDWTLFADDADRDVDAIHIEPKIGDKKSKADEHGTIIHVSALQGDWDFPCFKGMLEDKIARIVDPFVPRTAHRLIVARHNGERVLIPSIPESLLRAAHAICHVEFRMEDGIPILGGEVDYRHRHCKRNIDIRGAEVLSIIQTAIKRRAKRGHAAEKLIPVRPVALSLLGDFSCDIYWYNRRVVDAVDGLTKTGAGTRDEISNWSGGPMLYRHGFRILPYGDPQDDWLALDQRAFEQSGFKLNRQQMIGRVLLETPHSSLEEQTNREGFISSETSEALKRILSWVVHTEMRGIINEADKREQIERRAADQDTKALSDAQKRVDAALDLLRKQVGDAADEEMKDLSQRVAALVAQSQHLAKRINDLIDEADKERSKFVYLAGIGLMTEFIFHELERAVNYTMQLIARGAVQQATIDSLLDQLKTLHKRIVAFDELTTSKRQTKSSFDLDALVGSILENHSKEFERHSIEVSFVQPPCSFSIKAVRGMVIQIIENLIVNAVYWLKQQKHFEPGFKPALRFRVDIEGKFLTIEDNGPGVIDDRRERIFEPFVTTKPTGQGRGLGLYIARDMAEYHGWKLCMDDEIGRIREGRTNMFVLDMGQP